MTTKLKPSSSFAEQDQILYTVYKQLFNYMLTNKLNFYRLFEHLDADHNNFLSRDELSKFISSKLKLTLKP
jgi:hypothetical protein